jgi:hypothetical protein
MNGCDRVYTFRNIWSYISCKIMVYVSSNKNQVSVYSHIIGWSQINASRQDYCCIVNVLTVTFAHVLCYQTVQPNVAVLLCIPEIADSNLNPETSYPYCSFHAFLQSHQADSGIMTQIMPWPLSSTSFSIQHLSLILLFGAA